MGDARRTASSRVGLWLLAAMGWSGDTARMGAHPPTGGPVSLDHDDRSQSLLRAIVEGSDDAIVSKTLAGVVTSWNPGAERIVGYAADDRSRGGRRQRGAVACAGPSAAPWRLSVSCTSPAGTSRDARAVRAASAAQTPAAWPVAIAIGITR